MPMNKVWAVYDICVLNRTSKVFWIVEKVLTFDNGTQYGLLLTRNYDGKILKKIVPVEKAIPRKRS